MLLQPLNPFKLGYQSSDVQYVFNRLKAGESCSLVAMGSVGKSNLLQFMTQDNVRQHYLMPEVNPAHCVMVLVNSHEMVCLTGQALEHAGTYWSGYEIMLGRLKYAVMELYNSKLLAPQTEEDCQALANLFEEIEHYHSLILKPESLSMQIGLRHLEEALFKILSQDDSWRVVFLFDEVEELYNQLPPAFFQSLRGLRDNFKRRLMYVTASRHPLDELAEEVVSRQQNPRTMMVLEGFYELFHEFTRYISPLDYDSFKTSLERYFDRHGNALPHLGERKKEDLAHELFDITGGHAGLTRRSFLTAVEVFSQETSDHSLEEYLLYDEAFNKECKTIFDSLTPSEQLAINVLAQGKAPDDPSVIERLYAKHLIQFEENKPVIRLGILRRFVLNHPQFTRKGMPLPP